MENATISSRYPLAPLYQGIEGLQLAFGLAANAACFLYVWTRLQVNIWIWRLLMGGLTTTLIMEVSSLASLITISVTEVANVYSCAVLLVSDMITILVGTYSTMSIAVVRYYLATKMAANEAFNISLIKLFVRVVILLPWAFVLFFILYLLASKGSLNISLLVAACAKRPLTPETPIIVIMFTAILSVIVSMIYDLNMFKFMRKRNEVAPIEMAVWSTSGGIPRVVGPRRVRRGRRKGKLGSKADSVKLAMTVPVKATIIGAASLAVCILLLVAFQNIVDKNEITTSTWLVILAGQTMAQFSLPVVVSVAIKSNKKNNVSSANCCPQPPRDLQFHE